MVRDIDNYRESKPKLVSRKIVLLLLSAKTLIQKFVESGIKLCTAELCYNYTQKYRVIGELFGPHVKGE